MSRGGACETGTESSSSGLGCDPNQCLASAPVLSRNQSLHDKARGLDPALVGMCRLYEQGQPLSPVGRLCFQTMCFDCEIAGDSGPNRRLHGARTTADLGWWRVAEPVDKRRGLETHSSAVDVAAAVGPGAGVVDAAAVDHQSRILARAVEAQSLTDSGSMAESCSRWTW